MSDGRYEFNMPMSAYLADPCPEPSLSTSIVCALVEQTARHAKALHPRYGGAGSKPQRVTDEGSAIHSLAFGGAPVVFVGEVSKRSGKDAGEKFLATDWKTQDAKDEAIRIRTEGGIPLLEHQRPHVEAAAEQIRRRIAKYGPGIAEVTGLAKINGVWIRTRADWLTDDGKKDIEVKTVETADAQAFVRAIYQNGYDVQAELRMMVHKALSGDEREFFWLPAERASPYETGKWITPSDEMREHAQRKIKHATETWKRCLDTGEFPGYGDDIVWAHPPNYAAWDLEGRGL